MNDDCGTLGRSSLPSSFGCFRWVLQIGGLALPTISIFSFIPGMTWTQIRLMTADDSFYLIQLPWHVFPYSPIYSYLVASQSSTWRLMGRVSCRTLASLNTKDASDILWKSDLEDDDIKNVSTFPSFSSESPLAWSSVKEALKLYATTSWTTYSYECDNSTFFSIFQLLFILESHLCSIAQAILRKIRLVSALPS